MNKEEEYIQARARNRSITKDKKREWKLIVNNRRGASSSSVLLLFFELDKGSTLTVLHESRREIE